jgi:hypothetical protein
LPRSIVLDAVGFGIEMIHKGDSFRLEEDRLHATLIFERPIQGRREPRQTAGPKARDAGLPGTLDHAARHDPLGCRTPGANGFRAGSPRRPIPIKKHGRLAGSLFALGRSALRTIFAAANPPQISPFRSQLLSPPPQLIEISGTLNRESGTMDVGYLKSTWLTILAILRVLRATREAWKMPRQLTWTPPPAFQTPTLSDRRQEFGIIVI